MYEWMYTLSQDEEIKKAREKEMVEKEKGMDIRIEEKQRAAAEYLAFLRAEATTADIDEVKRRSLEAQRGGVSPFEIKMRLGDAHPDIEKVANIEKQVSAETEEYLYKIFQDGMLPFVDVVDEGDIDVVQQSANYEGNMTILTIDRLNNPQVRAQLMQLLYMDRKCDVNLKKTPPKEQVEDTASRMIKAVASSTPVTFKGYMPSASTLEGIREGMDVLWRPAGNIMGETYGTLQKSYVEAHEKGHTIRKIRSAAAAEYMRQGFDFGAILLPDDRVSQLIQYSGYDTSERLPDRNEIIQVVVRCLSQPAEILERMAQLKNYYGMSGNEVFTRQHLNYAREHYREDTHMDNYMTEFFQAITPRTEDRFLELINSCGV